MIRQVLLQELYRSLGMRTHTMLVTVINAIRSAMRLAHMPAKNAVFGNKYLVRKTQLQRATRERVSPPPI